MRLSELINSLQELSDSGMEDCEVQIVHQQSWPLREQIGGVWVQPDVDAQLEKLYRQAKAMEEAGDLDEVIELEAQAQEVEHGRDYDGIVFLVANGRPDEGTPYGPKEAFEERW